jgi:glycosyltransferase involved in cell wall biosynthesis
MRICSITPHQLLNNPRIVREADALAAAGHDVRVVAVQLRPEQSALDSELTCGRRWRLQTVNIERTPEGRAAWLRSGARQKIATRLWRLLPSSAHLAGLAYARTFSETIGLATAEPVDLIIAHTQPMLAAAWYAARAAGCRWGFDCEDILSEEFGEGIADPRHQALVRFVERTFIPRADYVTVASAEFARWLAERYGVRDATLISNVPSVADAPEALQPGFPEARSHLALYWFSISIGPQRGIEDAIRALPLIDVPVELHLRGRILPGYERELRQLIASVGAKDRVHLHPLAPPTEVLRVAAGYDVGLVLTQPCCENHELAVPNKIYAYMLSGLAVGATVTRGHRSVLDGLDFGFEYEPGNAAGFASGVNALVRDPARLRKCRTEAFRLARTQFNWETEQGRLVEVIARLEVQRSLEPATEPVHAV